MFRKWAHGLVIGLLLGSLFVAFPAAQNYVWSSINGVPLAPSLIVADGGSITVGTGGSLRSGTTAGDTLLLQAYDTDTGPAYTTLLTLTSGTTPYITLAPGAIASPSLVFDAGYGWYRKDATQWSFGSGGNETFRIGAAGLKIPNSAVPFMFGGAENSGLFGEASAVLALKNSATAANIVDMKFRIYSLAGGSWEHGSASELVTIAAAATTDTTANLLPANAIIEAVTARVTTVIPTAATFTVGDATTAARFATGVAAAAGTTVVGLTHADQAAAAGPIQTTAAKIRITPNASPADNSGRVRVTVYYRQFVAPPG
jgi:hypothetical protein